MNYLPDAGRGGVPALYKEQNQTAEGDFANEREILYKVLFDMRKDIADLKKLTGELMQNDEISEEWKTDNSSLIRRIYDEDSNREVAETNVNGGTYLPVYQDNVEAEIQTDTFEASHDVVEEQPVTLQEKELEMIKNALERNQNKRKDAAEELGISERTLYRKIKQYNL